MRKLTVTVIPNLLMKKMMAPIFKRIDSIELKELMRMDFSKGKKIGVGEITIKEDFDLTKEKFGKRMEILDILSKEGKKYTCLVKVHVPKAGRKLLQFFDFDLIYSDYLVIF